MSPNKKEKCSDEDEKDERVAVMMRRRTMVRRVNIYVG